MFTKQTNERQWLLQAQLRYSITKLNSDFTREMQATYSNSDNIWINVLCVL